MLAREQKKSVIDQYGTHATDTGSPEVQVALSSERIGQLTDHFKTRQKDHGSRRGLLMLVSKRRRLLDYLKQYDSERYKTVVQRLGLRKSEAVSVWTFVPISPEPRRVSSGGLRLKVKFHSLDSALKLLALSS